MLKTYPISYLVEGQSCLVVGGGEIAARKAKQLCRSGAEVTIIALEIVDSILDLQSECKLQIEQREFIDEDIKDVSIVIAATNDEALNLHIGQLAMDMKCLVNVVNQPEAGNFIVPSVVNRDPVSIAISTSGASPVLARLLRARIETMIPASFGKLAGLIADYRQRAIKRFPEIQARRNFWEKVLQGKVAELLFSGQAERAKALLEDEFDSINTEESNNGEVYIVGGGPGSPDLLTFRALRLMQQADVVLYDRLVSPAIVDLVNQHAERIYVGKARSNHSLPQQDINQLLVDLAKQGKRVLRLKGGDPFIFGRGGEEIELLTENNIPFQVVPGITAANGCSSYAGIPLTHRDYAQSCLFITGHLKDGTMKLNWPALVQPQQTLVVYMGTHGLDVLSQQLIEHGMSSDMPAAIIEQGTTEHQQVYTTTVEGLPSLPEKYEIKPPSMIIIGQVVQLRQQLDWYESHKMLKSDNN